MGSKIDEIMLNEVCGFGTGPNTCRYLLMGDGFECAKLTSLKATIDARVEAGTFTATGDNCEGIE